MCPFVAEYIQEISQNQQSSNKQLSFIIQVLDSTAQQTLLVVAVILCNAPAKKFLFPKAPRSFAETHAISYSPSVENNQNTTNQIVLPLTPLGELTENSEPISFNEDVANNHFSYPSHFSNGMPNSRFSSYETYQDDGDNLSALPISNGFMYSQNS